MTLSRRSTIKAISVVGTGSALTGTALAVNEHEDDERESEDAPADDEETGAIRVGHFSPDAPNVDVYVDDQRILSDVGYDELSPYLEIVPGTYTLTITAAGDDEPVYEGTIAVADEFYTAAAIGELEGESAATDADDADDADDTGLDDASDEPAESATAAAVQEDDDDTVSFGNDTDDDDDAGFGNDSGDDDDAGFGNDTDDDDDDLEDDPEADGSDALEEDDTTDDADTGTFDVLLLVDTQQDDVEEETAPLRLVHAVPDAPAVDVADGETGAAIFEDVGFTEPSGYVPVEPGSQTVELFPADEGDLGDDADDAATNDTDDGDGFGAETETDDEESEDEDDVISRPDPVAAVELDLEADTAHTAFAIGYLEEQDDEELTADDGDNAGDDAGDEGEAEDDDRAFAVRVATDGVMSDESTDDDESEVETDELESDDASGTNETEPTDDGLTGTTDDKRNETSGHGTNDSDGYHADDPAAADD